MTDRPMLFSGPMVRAMMTDCKVQDRRLLKSTQSDAINRGFAKESIRLPHFIGDRIWVQESFSNPPDRQEVTYKADGSGDGKWASPIYMPRWASRITLTITDVRVQRVQDITEADAMAEGATSRLGCSGYQGFYPGWSMDWFLTDTGKVLRSDISLPDPQMAYANYWNTIHGPGAWDRNDWVTARTFTVRLGNIDD